MKSLSVRTVLPYPDVQAPPMVNDCLGLIPGALAIWTEITILMFVGLERKIVFIFREESVNSLMKTEY